MQAEDFLATSELYVWPDHYSVVKATGFETNCFAMVVDRHEVTLVQKTAEVSPGNVIEEEKGWRILTFETVLPFGLTGFLAAVATALAQDGIAVFALSGFSTDHILVKNDQLVRALEALKKLGVKIKN